MAFVTIRYPGLALRDAVYSRLNADLAHTVYKRESNQAVSPYVVIGEIQAEDWSTKTSGGMTMDITIEIQSGSSSGATEVLGILDEVLQSITKTQLDMSADNFFANPPFIEFSQIIRVSEHNHRGIVRAQIFIDDIT